MRRNPDRPIAERAYGTVRDAIIRGTVAPAKCCERCGTSDRPCSDGRRYIQAHHHAGYENALTVQWLCPKCHRKETPLPSGERNGAAKLNPFLVGEAVRMHAEGAQFTAIAKLLGVDRTTIARAVKGKSWLAARGGASNQAK